MHRWLGSILVLASAISFGFMPLFKHWAEGVSVPMLLGLRFGIGAAALAGLALATRQRWPRGRVLLALFAMGALGYFGESYFYFSALSHAPSGLVSLLLYTYPGVVTVLSVLFLKEKMTVMKIIALVLAVAGSALTALPAITAGVVEPLGVVLGLACAVSYALYIVAGAKLPKDIGAFPKATIVSLGACISFAIAAAIRAASVGEALPTTGQQWGGILALGLICTVIGVAGFLAGLARVGPVRASTLSSFEPVMTALVGVIALGESLSPVQMVGGVLILIGAVVSARAGEDAAEALPEPVAH